MTYLIRNQRIDLANQINGSSSLSIDGKKASWVSDLRGVLPDTVFAYYSGPSNRLEAIFEKPLAKFRDDMMRQVEGAHQRMIYGRPIHSQFVLLSFLVDGSLSAFPFLGRELGITGVESVLFVLKEPSWAASRKNRKGKADFWGAQGVVRSFLTALYASSLAPLLLKIRVTTGLRQHKDLDHLFLYLPGQAELQALVSELRSDESLSGARQLFTTLESAFVSDLISDVRVQLTKGSSGQRVTFHELSEGEQQLLMVLGLLRFTKEEESLFLLDEPDTHLNPVWSLRFLDLIDEAVGDRQATQMIIASHDPVAISLLKRNQVRQLSPNADGTVRVDQPETDPVEMGVSGVLMSELFGFPSMFSPARVRDLDRRKHLTNQESRTSEEQRELEELDETLGSATLASLHPDPLYARFLMELDKLQERRLLELQPLTRQQSVDYQRLVREVLEQMDPTD
ncbi:MULTISPECIES: ATP-binding protein [unclassified Microbacterium]|uniref:ATP-binding protein n=1 Tax=unclassified Microbacterium TaxID=2609290 RepID=UPI00214CF359|nr:MULTISPECIES: ATP-binding protein [unclassified Microbacterium]MCR2810650.1 ATP-binding protein [Microbacterium sp. zg.B185]WIM18187.1 ATP-binding protein [Microbacterium sp. zg-B185]